MQIKIGQTYLNRCSLESFGCISTEFEIEMLIPPIARIPELYGIFGDSTEFIHRKLDVL